MKRHGWLVPSETVVCSKRRCARRRRAPATRRRLRPAPRAGRAWPRSKPDTPWGGPGCPRVGLGHWPRFEDAGRFSSAFRRLPELSRGAPKRAKKRIYGRSASVPCPDQPLAGDHAAPFCHGPGPLAIPLDPQALCQAHDADAQARRCSSPRPGGERRKGFWPISLELAQGRCAINGLLPGFAGPLPFNARSLDASLSLDSEGVIRSGKENFFSLPKTLSAAAAPSPSPYSGRCCASAPKCWAWNCCCGYHRMRSSCCSGTSRSLALCAPSKKTPRPARRADSGQFRRQIALLITPEKAAWRHNRCV
jgi:hypothetical protein